MILLKNVKKFTSIFNRSLQMKRKEKQAEMEVSKSSSKIIHFYPEAMMHHFYIGREKKLGHCSSFDPSFIQKYCLTDNYNQFK
jgi:hypothetical protein